ncbi:MAG: winged helix-turn-helix domain-containing protein [Anaerolineae bacterium]
MSSILEVLFSSTARVQVLRLFLLNPDSQFYQREIERETGQPIRAVQREVERLEEIDLLLREPEGNRVFYRLNPDFPLLAELTALFQKDDGGESLPGVVKKAPPPAPETIAQPFAWMETRPVPPLSEELRRRQVEGEWDRAY